MEESFKKEIEPRIAKFKNDGLQFIYDDRKSNHDQQIFQLAFAKFINDSTQDEVQEFIAQIKNIKDKFHLLQDNQIGDLCSYVLSYVKDPDRKTLGMQALFDAGMDYSFLKGSDDRLFLYSNNSCARLRLEFDPDVSEICVPYLKAVLSSKNYDKFVEAVQDIHSQQYGLRRPDMEFPVRPDFINAGLEAALEYLRFHPVVGRKILKPFYDNLTDPQSVLGKYCSEIQNLANENRVKLSLLEQIEITGNQEFGDERRLRIRKENVKVYETLQAGVEIFKDRFQSICPSLKNLSENTINGVLKDKKSIEELPITTVLKTNLNKNYHDTLHPEKREAYHKEYSKSDMLSKFTQPQISSNSDGHTAKNKTESKHDQTNNKSTIRRKSP